MTNKVIWRALLAGWTGGFCGNAFLGAVFSSPWTQAILYDPHVQSELFRNLTPLRNIPLSVAGLVALSGVHGLLFVQLAPAIPGRTRLRKGLWWGFAIWAMYWLTQEWFIYVTLLREPLPLATLELLVLLAGSLLEGMIIAALATPLPR